MKSYKFKINGNEYNVDINSVEGNMAAVTVNGTPYQGELEMPLQRPLYRLLLQALRSQLHRLRLLQQLRSQLLPAQERP